MPFYYYVKLPVIPQELLNLIMVTNEKKDDGTFLPIEENADGDVRPEFPKISFKFFDPESTGDPADIHGEHKGVHLPLNFNLLSIV